MQRIPVRAELLIFTIRLMQDKFERYDVCDKASKESLVTFLISFFAGHDPDRQIITNVFLSC